MAAASLERATADLAEQLSVLVNRELQRQYQKWGGQNHDPCYWLGILGEEYGEVCRAVIEYREPDEIVVRLAERATR